MLLSYHVNFFSWYRISTSNSEPESSTSVAAVYPAHAEDKTLCLFTTVDLNSYLIINGMGSLSETLWVETVLVVKIHKCLSDGSASEFRFRTLS